LDRLLSAARYRRTLPVRLDLAVQPPRGLGPEERRDWPRPPGLYLGLAILLIAAMYSTHSILIALRDGAVGIILMLLMYKIYDLIDRRDFAQELADGNTMLGMELEGLFILLSAVIVGAMNYTAG
jgi:hypothetical protein